MLAPWKKNYDQPRQQIKKQRRYFVNKGPYSQSYGFSSGHVWMWDLDHKENWEPKNWCFWTVVWEKTLESHLDSKIKPVNPQENQSWIFIGRTDVEAEAPILWPPDAKNWLIGKDPDAGKDWRQEKGITEDEMVGWHHRLSGHEFEWALAVGDGKEAWRVAAHGVAESDMTEGLNWTDTSVDYLSNTRVCVLSCFGHVQLFATPRTVSCQAPLLCPPSGDLPDPGTEVASPAFPSLQVDSLLLSHQGSSSDTYRPPQ